MNIVSNKGVTFLTFDLLEKAGVKHCFSTRIGGVSEGCFESMNLGFGRGDSDENVRKNFELMADALEVDVNKMCLSQQTHTTNVRVITEQDAGNGIIRPLPYTDVDGMVTNVKGITLVTFYADCIPLYFYDPEHEAIGLSHGGWRGTVGKIGKNTIELMARTYGTNPSRLICGIGPGVGGECYEVSGEVVEKFREAFGEKTLADNNIVRSSTINPDNPDKYMLDLKNANRLVFEEAGVRRENIEISEFCTHCDAKLFYSHRIMGADRGSLAAFMKL